MTTLKEYCARMAGTHIKDTNSGWEVSITREGIGGVAVKRNGKVRIL
jgi:hypothetical protein